MPRKNEGECTLRECKDGWIVDLTGEVDLYRSGQIRKQFEQVLNKKPKGFLVNLVKVSYMDSSGLATLIEAFQIAKKKGIFFGLLGVNATLKGLFEITHLEKVFQIYRTEEEALEALDKGLPLADEGSDLL
ncbi:MAG: STAS domain-containing protein [Chlamydiae bacterium]|nr:STAS domain-containing protein [Chlamydiota bacterium]MBI3266057.1 STAS domain-containing protein [Chlamydiota bacterium]